MNLKKTFSGISATTQVNPQGGRFSREVLEQTAKDISARQQFIFWKQQTTLPPLGLITRAWVEKREDGEYQLKYEGIWLDEEDSQFLPQSQIKGLDLKWEDVRMQIGLASPTESGQLSIYYDPRTFDDRAVAPVLAKMNQLVPTEVDHYYKKNEPPTAAVWVMVGFAGGQIASSLFLKRGVKSPEAAIKAGKRLHRNLASELAAFLACASPEGRWLDGASLGGRKPDVIWGMPVPDSDAIIEGACEEATEKSLAGALERLPVLYAAARHLIHQNPPDTFSQLKFLYLPGLKIWDINYLVLAESNRLIKGARYFEEAHPLHRRYAEALQEVAAQAGNG